MDENFRELQLLPANTPNLYSTWKLEAVETSIPKAGDSFDKPSVNLQLSISLQPPQPSSNCFPTTSTAKYRYKHINLCSVRALKWEAEEQIRLAAAEKAYAEQVREMAKREMELAQRELLHARIMWENARSEVEKAERLKERAASQRTSSCMEVTCQACWRQFCP